MLPSRWPAITHRRKNASSSPMRSATTLGDLRVMRGDLQRRVGQEATEAAFERALDDFGQEGLDRLTWRKRFFDPRDACAHIGVQIAVEALRKERPLVTEGIVDARLAKPHRVAEIAHGGAGVSGRPKTPHRRFQRNAFVELTRSGQSRSILLEAYWSERYIIGRLLSSPRSLIGTTAIDPTPGPRMRRQETVHEPDANGACVCPDCGAGMAKLGEDVKEVLDYVPGRFQVIRHVRPRYACKACDAIHSGTRAGVADPTWSGHTGHARATTPQARRMLIR